MPSLRSRITNKPISTSPSRRSRRLIDSATATASGAVTRSATRSISKAIEKITDFKIVQGTTFYYVQRTGGLHMMWESEDLIHESDPAFKVFCEKIEAAGYSIRGSSTSASSHRNGCRPPRLSKTRALLRFQPMGDDGNESGSDSDQSMVLVKDAHSRKRTRSSGSKATAKKPRRGLARKAEVAEARDKRKNERAGFDDAESVEISNADCCLRCKVQLYRQAVNTGDVEQLTVLINDKDHIPGWYRAECQQDCDHVMKEAISGGNQQIVELLLKDGLKAHEQERVEIPRKYNSYGDDTGYVSRYSYGRALRKVNESRGNRQGNRAFFRNAETNLLDVDMLRLGISTLDHSILAAMQEECVTDDMADVVCSTRNAVCGNYFWEGIGIYFCVASGNWQTAGNLIIASRQESNFNHLHIQVLKHSESEPLDAYRKNQILKRANGSFKITPYLCAAIHPSRKFLADFYEALAPQDRVETDEMGRGVAHFAAASSTPDCLEYLIEQDFGFLAGDKFKITPLLQAARYGRHRNIRPLVTYLSGGRYPSTEFADHTLLRMRYRPLHYAAYNGHAETCRALIDAGATVDAIESTSRSSPLAFAALRGHAGCVKTLIEHGKADPELGDKYGRTPLHLACMRGSYDIVRYLLFQVGVDANVPDTSSNRPIHYASAFGHLRVIRLLIEYGGADPSLGNIWRSSPCAAANMKGHVGIIKYLLTSCAVNPDFRDQEGRTLLHMCAMESVTNSDEISQVLLKSNLLYARNANPNLQTLEGDTVLHTLTGTATFKQHRPAGWTSEAKTHTKASVMDDKDGIAFQTQLGTLALKAGADLEITNSNGETPLAMAMRCRNTYMAEFLIEEGANYWNIQDKDGNTFFHHLLDIAADLDTLSTRRDIDREVKVRRAAELERIWTAMKETVCETNIDLPNNEGLSAILYGVRNAVRSQNSTISAEKRRVLAAAQARSNDPIVRTDAVFEFQFHQWINLAEKVIRRFKPDMNATVQLPKDFKGSQRTKQPSAYPPETGYGVLHFAAKTQHARLLSLLMGLGCDPNYVVHVDGTAKGDPPILMSYCAQNKSKNDFIPCDTNLREWIERAFNIVMPDFETLLPDAVKSYLEAGADPCLRNHAGTSVLTKAAASLDIDILETLCSSIAIRELSGADNRDESSRTALMHAIDAINSAPSDERSKKDNYVSAIKALLLANADPNLQYPGGHGDTIIMKALRMSIPSLVSILLNDTRHPIDHSVSNNRLETMAMIACSQQNVCLSSVYFDALSSAYAKSYMDMNVCNHKGYSALYLASKAGDEYAVSVLLNCKADPNQAVGPNREPPLFAAVRGAFLPVVETLINRGAYVNAKNDEGTTALHLAILTKKYPVIKLLLEHGAYVGVADKYGRTPLHCAIQCSKSMINASMRVERLLLEKGADINATDILGRTPLHIAFIDFDVIPHMNTLRDTFKNVKKLVKSRKQAAEMDKEAEKSVSMYGHPKSMATNQWIREAVIAKHKRLQRRRASSSSEEDDLRLLSTQELALLETYAEMKSEIDYPLARKSDPIAIINFLLRYPVLECDKADRFGRTPLHYAAATGAFSCSSMLCSRGVVVERLDNDMNMPLQLSLLYKHVDYSIMLCNNGVVPSNVMQLPSGEAVSTFKYSLSQGFLNMAFLILDRNQNILELLRDALTTGVFHVADILMNETNYTFLKESLADTNQNLWHVLADFTPFDREIWSEYLFDFMEKALHLSVVPETDSRGRSPIHYAAKHGQDALLKQLLRMGVTINKLDEDGIAELWYAVYSGHVSTVKILLEAGADVMQGTASDKKESILLMATESGNAEMVTLLLSAHAPTDDDSRYGRSTALMSACTKNSNLILQALLQSGADPNVPSWVATKHEGNEVFVLVHPILFAAGDTLKLLLEAGANVNVIGPKVKPWEGRSCFMACQDRDDLMMMLNYSVDVNLIDDYSRRTIFYQHLFASCIKKDVLDRMFNSTAPTVNELDPDTGMTPLEYAIRNCSSDYVSHLLRLGADPNVESSGESADRCSIAGLYSKEPQNAVFHAIAHNDLGILREICTHSLYPINWFAVDSKQRTAIMFLLSEYSHENQEMLEFIASAMGEDFGAIVELVDSEGNRALDYARMRQRENLSNVLVKYGAPVPVDIPMIENESVNPMDTDDDFISMQAVEMDADEERENLEKEAAAKKRMESDTKLKDAQEKKGKSNGVDPLSKLEKIGVLLMDDDDRPYDIMIQKIDVGNGPYGTALFYKLSIIYNTVLDVYVLWTRWGAFGEDGMHQKTPYLIKDEAVAEFCSIFRSKTGNIWGTKFVTKPGRYELIRALPKRKQEILKEFSFFSASAKSELHPSLSNAMHLFCNLEALQNAYKNLQLDIPVGHIPQRLIDEGYRIMKKIKKSAEIWLQLHQQIYSKEVRAKKKEITHELIQLSNEYFKLFPPVNLKRGIQPLILSAKISAEYARLHNIGYFSFASNVILAAKRRVQEVHPLDYCYRALHCRLGVISADSVEYRMVDAYMNSTVRQGKYEIAHLFSVDRSGEAERFASIPSPKTNRMLLWHGSHIHNFLGIMKQGLRVTPSTSLQQTGSMFGQGIYFADTFTKSINYSTRNAGDANCPGYAMILLCDVALGNICEMGYYNATKFANSTYHSVKARGREGPSKQNALFDKDGVEIPMGPTVTYDFTGLDYIEQPRLSYNEYVVYDESRVKIRYVAVIRDRECCTLCQKMTSEEMRPLAGQKIGKEPVCYNLGAFEAKMLSFYVSRHDVDLQHLFDAKLDAYLKSEHYKTIASPPLPLNKSSEVCKECVDTIATSILIEEASSALPSDVQERPICRYGSDCRTKNDHIHAKKYQHWLHPNSAKAPQYQNDAKVDNMDGSDDDNDDDDSEEDN